MQEIYDIACLKKIVFTYLIKNLIRTMTYKNIDLKSNR